MPSSVTNSLAGVWPTTFVFLILSAALFTCLFEWDRYQIITVSRLHSSSVLDKALVFWLLAAKSLAWFVPVLLVWAVLIAFRLRWTATLILNIFSIAIFYCMALDLVSVGLKGYHAWDYVPHLRDMSRQWVAEIVTADALIVFGAFVISDLACFIFARWAISGLERRAPWIRSVQAAAVMTMAFIVVVVGVVPALVLFKDRNLLGRIFPILAITTDVRESLQSFTEKVVSQVGWISSNRKEPSRPEMLVDPKDELLAMKFAHEAAEPGPADLSAFVKKPDLPNVILIIFESFRHHAISPEMMKQLDAWSQQGLRLRRHYAGSNCSHLGLFPLFYGRSSLGYYQTLDRHIPPQLLESLRRSGYRITLLTSGEIMGHRRLEEFINNTYCDRILVEGGLTGNDLTDWPDSDRRKLARLKSIINTPQDQPQFVFFYLLSSHYGYAFPAEFEIFKEAPGFWQFFNPREQTRSYLARYANSLLFLEDELMKVLRSVDLRRNIVVITGDHGESMGEDGVFRHTTRMSEIQLRVPCVMVGAGVEPRKIPCASVHMDILPTLLHVLGGKSVAVRNCQGRDLIADDVRADEVVLAPADGSQWEGLLIIKEKKRLAFKTETFSAVPSAEFTGVVDEFGQYRMESRRY